MVAAVVFPDVEAHLIGRVQAALDGRREPFTDGVRVSNRWPETADGPVLDPGRLVVVRDDGGPATSDVRATARIGVNVWAESEAVVSDLANMVRAVIDAMPDGEPVVYARMARPYQVEDEAGRPRMYMTGELSVRGVSL